jgi:hypothetical protein
MVGCQSPEHAEKIREGVKKFWREHPEAKLTLGKIVSERMKGRPVINYNHEQSEQQRTKIQESMVGGFWYGNVRNDPKNSTYRYVAGKHVRRYCELWNEDLKERIRAYWGYVSALSGLEETSKHKSGTLRSISCHHVYYQKKACCVWDEDERGYYANINTGSYKNPIIEKYYIDGDPNKFVTLTSSEHKKTDTNKLHWIRVFEDLIEEQGGKCYFTKQEIAELLA